MTVGGRRMALAGIAVIAGLGGPAHAAGAACAGPPVATALVADGAAARPALGFVRDGAPGRRSPSGVVLAGVALPATAREEVRRRLAAKLAAAAGSLAVVYGDRVRLDRRDRVAGQVSLADPSGGRAVWLQAALVSDGLLVAGTDAGPCTGALLAAEARARAAGAGLHAGTPVGDADGVTGLAGVDLPAFVVAEGRIDTVGMTARTTYLNFGRNRRSDLTVRLSRRNSAGFAGKKDPVGLAGLRVRVRGWAYEDGGPDLFLSDPDMIEILEERRGDRRTR